MTVESPVTQVPARDRLSVYLHDVRALVLDEIKRIVPRDSAHTGGLYELMLDYPLRGGKGLRPALAMATHGALGGSLTGILPTAAVLELYHNAFLVHDDVEDGSERRRQEETLHRMYGVPIAVNVGDGMLALSLAPLLANTAVLGVGRALRILHEIARMSRESAEGQMMELDWIRRIAFGLPDRAYIRMVTKKSAWYSFISPVAVGAIAAGAETPLVDRLRRFAGLLGVAFQIQDDVLNLVGEESSYGKEIGGDLWEGKHTLILIHALRGATTDERARAHAVLCKRRDGRGRDEPLNRQLVDTIENLARDRMIGTDARDRLLGVLGEGPANDRTLEDVRFLRELIDRSSSIDYAWREARKRADRAARCLAKLGRDLAPSDHLGFLEDVVGYVVTRDR